MAVNFRLDLEGRVYGELVVAEVNAVVVGKIEVFGREVLGVLQRVVAKRNGAAAIFGCCFLGGDCSEKGFSFDCR